MFSTFRVIAAMLAAFAAVNSARAEDLSRSSLLALVAQIQRADYEDQRADLMRLRGQLEPFRQERDKKLVSRVEYWQGFALWRRTLNGFNDQVDPAELGADLEQALKDFNQSLSADPKFADAKIGALSCVSNLMYLNRGNPARMKELIAQSSDLSVQAKAEAPENPRLYWVLGPNVWYAPPDRGGSQAAAIEMYKKGLDLVHNAKSESTDSLDPSWGEPEILMNLGWSNLHKSTPDPDAALQYAQSALKLVPYWHYVKDVLLPQIQQTIRDGKSSSK